MYVKMSAENIGKIFRIPSVVYNMKIMLDIFFADIISQKIAQENILVSIYVISCIVFIFSLIEQYIFYVSRSVLLLNLCMSKYILFHHGSRIHSSQDTL